MNLAALLLAAAPERPDAPALRFDDVTVSHGDLRAESGRLAAGLVGAGVRPGDRVVLAYPNSVDFVTAYIGVLTCGAVAVPLNPTSPAPEVNAQLDEVDPRFRLGVLAGGVTVAETAAAEPMEPVERGDDDLAALLFTAGTAGAPKAAMLTHGNLAANVEQVQRHPGMRIHADDVALVVLPFFHIFGLNVVLGTALAAGACVMVAAEFHAEATAALIASERITVVAGVPSMFAAWVGLPPGRDSDFSGVRLAVSGAAHLPIAVAGSFRERYGVAVREGYGLTEASPIVTTTAVDATLRPGSIGPPLPGVEVRIVDEDGGDVFAGDPGEIWVRGPSVFPGYWGNAEATARVLTPDGWLRTGDIAVADDDGYLSLVDRAKDLVIVSGFNVYPAEVEAVLRAHPDVADVAVAGVADPRSGEALAAYIVAAGSRSGPSDATLRAFVGERLARYKVPTTFELVDELPRNRLGKLLRRELGARSDPSVPPPSGSSG
ncbi:MAG TPA: AMP-binding protein [Acidimicrobiia bacterium]|nr:AMP-binding protein [Acidimicrobiia bacterium]